jgi:hypothetical protein
VVADTWGEVLRRLQQAERDPAKRYGIEASAAYEQAEEIWSSG